MVILCLSVIAKNDCCIIHVSEDFFIICIKNDKLKCIAAQLVTDYINRVIASIAGKLIRIENKDGIFNRTKINIRL